MEVMNGLYAAIKSGSGVHSVFIDEEQLELQAMNQRSEANRRRSYVVAEQQIKAEQAKQKQAEERRRRKEGQRKAQQEMTSRMLRQEGWLVGSAVGVVILDALKAIAPALTVTALVGILGGMCFLAGRWFGRRNK